MSGSASTSRSDDEAAIRVLYQQLMDGWNRGSGEAFAAPFAEDAARKSLHFINSSLIHMLKVVDWLEKSEVCDS